MGSQMKLITQSAAARWLAGVETGREAQIWTWKIPSLNYRLHLQLWRETLYANNWLNKPTTIITSERAESQERMRCAPCTRGVAFRRSLENRRWCVTRSGRKAPYPRSSWSYKILLIVAVASCNFVKAAQGPVASDWIGGSSRTTRGRSSSVRSPVKGKRRIKKSIKTDSNKPCGVSDNAH